MSYLVYMHKTPSGKIYIGQTCKNPKHRWGKNGNGYKSHKYFYNAIQKYGWDNIEHIILKQNLSKEDADYFEKYYIDKYNTLNPAFGYNLSEGGQSGGHPNPHNTEWNLKISKSVRIAFSNPKIKQQFRANRLGKKLSDETKEKISQAHLGKCLTDEHKQKISKRNKGKPGHIQNLETRQKISLAHIGKTNSEHQKEVAKNLMSIRWKNFDWQNKMSNLHKGNCYALGYKHTQEEIEKIRQSSLERKFTDETKQKISNALKGKPKSEEHRQKIGKIAKGRIWINNGEKSKMIYPEELTNYLQQGYIRGRLK